MSRSGKKTPIFGFSSSDSEKKDKRIANRSFRHKAKQVKIGKEPVTDMNEIMTTWAMANDANRYIKKPTPKQMRK